MWSLIVRFVKDDEGATMIEYGLIAALVSVVAIGALTIAGTNLNAVWSNIGSALSTAS